MRLNHIKSFYAFLLCFCSKRNEERGGWPWPTNCRGGRPRPKTLARQPTGKGQLSAASRPQAWLALAGASPAGVGTACGEAAKGRMPAVRPQGVAPRPGLPLVRAVASRGSACTRRHCPLARCRSRAAT
ncbi:hypothetical protein B296_00045210 [Ensete ventricosum]|uniref:Uncharacterized protein n=1 Tax=Ensete ventricosum TaxID=4639 RepID=A0A426WVU0_ENSVE|nr:hypothetical protein B296_00045210 [Ensete ventricosum]